jgi:glycosyltransferase involved in cell wall biosynthesis
VTAVHVLVPADIDDPGRPSGGNHYDRRLCQGLAALGWTVTEHPVPGSWPRPGAAHRAGLARVLADLPDGALTLLDGLIATPVPELVVPAARRLRPVLLVHLPFGDAPPGHRLADAVTRERAVLGCARAVLTTSGWTRRRLLARYPLAPARVHVAEPGVDPADPAPGTASGAQLLCVAAVTPHKGQEVLVEALARLADRPWECTLVGTLTRDPRFVAGLRRRIAGHGLADRIRLVGVRTGAELAAAYAAADALVLPSHGETFGMVVTEALATGLPVIASAVGGVPGALGRTADDQLPGLLVPPGDPAALAGALGDWLDDPALRTRLRRAAGERRGTLTDWAQTAGTVSRVLAGLAGARVPGRVRVGALR